jgi:hypothetical protein
MIPIRRSGRPRLRSAAILLTLLAAACDGGTGPLSPAELRKLAGDGAPGTAGAPLAQQAAVRVVDERRGTTTTERRVP